jgi:hypothetical protein
MNPPMAITPSPSDLVDIIICFLMASMNPPMAITLSPSDLESKSQLNNDVVLIDTEYLQYSKEQFLKWSKAEFINALKKQT